MSARSVARAEGLSRYAGAPCLRGHAGERRTADATCVECERERQRRIRPARRAYYRGWVSARGERQREYKANWQRVNSERTNAKNSAWKKQNLDKVAAQAAKQRADKLQRTPRWADLRKIEQVYTEAQWMSVLMGEPWHVDHVIPLRGKKVSGLHVHSNLQLLPGVENVRKNNRFEPG